MRTCNNITSRWYIFKCIYANYNYGTSFQSVQLDEVKRALNDRRMDMREASERARNRNEWRMIVTQF